MNEFEIVENDVFERKLSALRKTNELVDRLITDLGSWEEFPPHLITSLFKLLGCKPRINKY